MSELATAKTRALVVVLDALRPEFVTPDLMPNLSAFATRGARFVNARSTFPTETRVNQTAVITGTKPTTSGIVANSFVHQDVYGRRVVHTAVAEQIEACVKADCGGFIGAPTLSALLRRAGRTYASLSSGTRGGGFLLHHDAALAVSHRAHDPKGARYVQRAPELSVPPGLHDEIFGRFGVAPTSEAPAKAWISRAVDSYIDVIERDFAPDVMVLWLSEPDETFHTCGIGSPEALEAIRHVDREFGRIVDFHEKALERGDMHIIAMSDHGQVTLDGPPLDLVALLTRAGFPTAREVTSEARFTLQAANAGGIWSNRDGDDPGAVTALVAWLSEQDWCGPMFTHSAMPGTLPLASVGLGHVRAPDVAFCCSVRQQANAFGFNGVSQHDAPYPVGGGCHGGLSRYELSTVLMLAGAQIRAGSVWSEPAATTDILPTLLALLDLEVPDHVEGRCLREAMRTSASASEVGTISARPEMLSVRSEPLFGRSTVLSATSFAGRSYLNEARRD